MLLLLLLPFTPLLAFEQANLRSNQMRTVFKAYIREFHKDWVDRNLVLDEDRLAIFAKHYREVVKHNRQSAQYTIELNKFSDMPPEELDRFMGLSNETDYFGHIMDNNVERDKRALSGPLPASVDHNTNGLVTPVKNQDECGACWSFAGVGAFEGAYKQATGYLKSFSEQEALDCTYPDSRNGCWGGWYYDVFKYLQRTQRLSSYNAKVYKAKDETCSTTLPDNAIRNAVFDGYKKVTPGDRTLQAAAAGNVIAVAVYATTWFPYRSGIFTGCPQYPTNVNHAVVLTGYSPLYWTLKNSWGKDWGENGFIRVSRDNSQSGCKIASFPYYPLVRFEERGEKDEDDIFEEINKVNLATSGLASQSSTGYLGDAQHAIDGNSSTNFYNGHCSRTKIGYSNYWRVKLAQRAIVSSVVIVLRGDLALGDIDGATVHVGKRGSYWDKQCGSALYSEDAENHTLTVTCSLAGDYVTVDLFSLSARKAITLCEVMVYQSDSSDGCGSGMMKCKDGLCKPPSFC